MADAIRHETSGTEAIGGSTEADRFWEKACKYALRASEEQRNSDWYAIFASLSLEFLAKAALVQVHPALVIEVDNPRSLESAFGFGSGPGSTAARTISAAAAYARCGRLLADFEPVVGFCQALAAMRNQELHSGAQPFRDQERGADWLQKVYRSMQVLCLHLGRELQELVGSTEAEIAEAIMWEAASDIRTAVVARIHKCRNAAAGTSDDEADRILAGWSWPETPATFDFEGLACPACDRLGRTYGVSTGNVEVRVRKGEVTETATFVRSAFACVVCGLRLDSADELDAAGLAGSFGVVESFTPERYYGASGEASALEAELGWSDVETLLSRGEAEGAVGIDEAALTIAYQFDAPEDADRFVAFVVEHECDVDLDLRDSGTTVAILRYGELDRLMRALVRHAAEGDFGGVRLTT